MTLGASYLIERRGGHDMLVRLGNCSLRFRNHWNHCL
jgi:hypothetical protein